MNFQRTHSFGTHCMASNEGGVSLNVAIMPSPTYASEQATGSQQYKFCPPRCCDHTKWYRTGDLQNLIKAGFKTSDPVK